MPIELLGYSERGMMNALCDDLTHSGDMAMLGEFLSLIMFPDSREMNWGAVSNATMLVEQSFSDFGDADLLVLLEFQDGSKRTVFVEAKVSNDTDSWTTVEDRWDGFLQQLDEGEGNTSNLFVQLHRKVRLVEKLRDSGGRFTPDVLVPRGSLGTNQTVDRAARKVKGYVDKGDVWFVAILPDRPDALQAFFSQTFPNAKIGDRLPTWRPQRWGFSSWHMVAERLTTAPWHRTRATLEWNQGEDNNGQIFRNAPPLQRRVEAGQICVHDASNVYVASAGRGRTCRVVPLDGQDPGFFWRTKSVDVNRLAAPPEPIVLAEVPRLPQVGDTHRWNPREETPRLPAQSVNISIEPDTDVVVVGPSWATTRVRCRANGPNAPTFLVHTHHLKRK